MATEQIRYDTTAGQQELKRRGIRPVPRPDALTKPYWDAARNKQLVIQKCEQCGEFQHPPFEKCLQCDGGSLKWEPISGKGAVYTFIIDRRNMIPGFDEPYVVAQINPVEAKRDTVRITTNIRECPIEDVYIGMPVEAIFEDVNGTILPQFKPAEGAKLRSRGETPPER